tara:strand:+ start:476 stop:817 length:342 start_codon:yes stop_codon:yes gene_type:complete
MLSDMFRPATDLMNVPHDDNYSFVEWFEGDARIVISYTRQGDALDMHFAANKPALRLLRVAFDDFVELVKKKASWCTMIIMISDKPGVLRFVKKLGFKYMSDLEECKIYARFM